MRAGSMLFDLYGDFAIEGGRPGAVGLTVLVRLAAVLGANNAAVRAAATRMARDGWLRAERHGRGATYHLTERGKLLVEDGRERMFAEPIDSLDGLWCIVALSVPETRREIRDRLRKELTWLGFGSPSSGLCVSPRDYHAAVERLAVELGALEFVQIYRAAAVRPARPPDLVARAWGDLGQVNSRYEQFVERFSPQLERTRTLAQTAMLTERDAFCIRFALASQFRHCLYADPDLPAEMAPSGWHGSEARHLFLNFHALVTPLGMRYFDAVAGQP
jgi:phenylacetic acid degradation operon negative regulatory protein